MAEGQITRKDIIADDAISWGADYAKTLDLAIGKNKEFVTAIVSLSEANNRLRGSFNQAEFVENQKRVNAANNEAIGIWKEQIQLENNLISTKKKVELASEGTNRALVKERLELALINKEIKQEQLERLGLVSAYTKLNNARTEAKNKLRDLIASEKASSAEIKKATIEFDRLDAKVRKADRAVGDFSKNVGNYKSAFTGIKDIFGAFGIVGGLTAFATITKDIFNTTKELQSLDLALKSVTGSQENFNAQQTFLSTIAEKYGLEIKNLTKQYTAFYVAAKDKLAAQEIQDLFENIAKSGSALGLSNETLERSFVAVNQMLSKGTVASEELRGQLAEALPGAVQAMTKAVQILHPEIKNLTEKGLFEMIKSGKILASEVLPETARQLVILTGADKAEGIETLTKLTNKLSNDWTEMVRSINETNTSGFGMFVKEIVSGLSNILTFTSLIFKDEKQLEEYFKGYGKSKGLEQYQAVMKNIANTTKENQELTKKAMLENERENIRVSQATIIAEKKKRESIMGGDRALFHLQTKLEEDALVQIGKSGEIIKKIRESYLKTEPPKKVSTTTETDAERKKREAAEKKADKEALYRAKKLSDSEYELKKQRLEREIKLSDEIANEEIQSDEVRVQAIYNRQQKEEDLLLLTKKHLLDNTQLTANDRFRIEEDYANKVEDLNKKVNKEVEKINQFDEAKYTKDLEDKISKTNEAMNAEIQAENERFKSLGDLELMSQKDREKAVEDHEKKIFDIKKKFAIDALKLQASTLEKQLLDSDALPEGERLSAEKRQKIAESLSKAKADISELEIKNNDSKNTKIEEQEKEFSEKIKDLSVELYSSIKDLANSLFDAKIQQIDDEISKNNEYYDKQLELAGNDERQKDLLQKERDKKNEELEKKKGEAQKKAAIANRVFALADIAIKTAQALMAANVAIQTMNSVTFGVAGTAYGAWAIPAIYTIAGIQAAAVLATPIPKYKHGRKGGKGEIAEVGDGFVSEVITRADGSSPRITPNKPTLTYLNPGDIVHKSVEDYNRYVRASILNKFSNDNERVSNFQANNIYDSSYGKESLLVMKETLRAIKNQKNTTIVNLPKMDISHEIWKMKNKTWG